MKKLLIKMSKFIKCNECFVTTLNDDDSVCLKCGSKNTKRVMMNSRVFKPYLS